MGHSEFKHLFYKSHDFFILFVFPSLPFTHFLFFIFVHFIKFYFYSLLLIFIVKWFNESEGKDIFYFLTFFSRHSFYVLPSGLWCSNSVNVILIFYICFCLLISINIRSLIFRLIFNCGRFDFNGIMLIFILIKKFYFFLYRNVTHVLFFVF